MLIQTLMRVEWMTVPAEKTLEHIVARLSNRVFVGYPLCTYPSFVPESSGSTV